MNIDVRRIGPSDADLLNRVGEDVFDGELQLDRLTALLADSRHLLVVAIRDGEVIGQAQGTIHLSPDKPDSLYIDNMGVTPALWRKGIGGRLLDQLLEWGRERGCRDAWLVTEPDNTEARALYESRGAEPQPVVLYAYSGPGNGSATKEL